MVSASNIPKFPFLYVFRFFLDLRVQLFPLFFYATFHSYILTVYSYCLYQTLRFFFSFLKTACVMLRYYEYEYVTSIKVKSGPVVSLDTKIYQLTATFHSAVVIDTREKRNRKKVY